MVYEIRRESLKLNLVYLFICNTVSCLRARRGPLSSHCNVVTPAAGGGYACGYLKVNQPKANQPITVVPLNRNESSDDFGTNPNDVWIYFTYTKCVYAHVMCIYYIIYFPANIHYLSSLIQYGVVFILLNCFISSKLLFFALQ